MESEEKRRVYYLLSIKKYNNVIEDLDKVYEHISNQNYSDALANCRKAQESFFKRFLLNHKIKILNELIEIHFQFQYQIIEIIA